ncbi:hypothetical protein AURDEDRAFT_187346 [Auricularia subglabra TFB-10046 SS5]|nr:hypothetical protein AURDEDRAFT_187346 [Auricularia subglabra TFB-10046 SS5]
MDRRKLPYSSIREDADRVIAGITAAGGPTICAQCVVDLLLTLESNDHVHLAQLRAECHSLFNTCMLVLCVWPFLQKGMALRARLAENERRCARAHRAVIVGDHSRALYNAMADIIKAALCVGKDSPAERALAMNKSLCDKKGRWPTHLGQLLPLGEQETVGALLSFAETWICPAPHTVLSSLLAVARPVVWPILVSDRYRKHFILLLASMLDPSMLPDGDLPTVMTRSMAPLRTALHMLTVIRGGADALPRDMAQLVADTGSPDVLFSALSAAVGRLTDRDPQFFEIAQWLHDVYARIPAPRPPPPQRAMRWISVYATRHRPSMLSSLHSVIANLLITRSCSSPECGISPLRTESGKAFPVCAGCRVTRYCSKACQRRHWKGNDGDGVPHKDVCPLLKMFRLPDDATVCHREIIYKTYTDAERVFTAEQMETLNQWIMESSYELGCALTSSTS